MAHKSSNPETQSNKDKQNHNKYQNHMARSSYTHTTINKLSQDRQPAQNKYSKTKINKSLTILCFR